MSLTCPFHTQAAEENQSPNPEQGVTRRGIDLTQIEPEQADTLGALQGQTSRAGAPQSPRSTQPYS